MKFSVKNQLSILLFLSVVLLGVSSCKSRQQIIYTTSPVEEKENSRLFSDILTQAFPYSSFSSKLTLNISTGTRTMSSKASLRIARDKAIQISVQPLFGVEMFRFYMDKETLVLLDRMNKRYVKESLTDLKNVYPVGFDYNSLQAMFTNALFIAGQESVGENDYRRFGYTQTQNTYLLKSKDETSGIEYSFGVNAADRVTFMQLLDPKKQYALQWGYANFSMVNEKTFPHKMDIIATTPSRRLDVGLSFSDIVLNGSAADIRMNIPSGYTQTSLSDILKIISSNQ